MRNFGYGSTTLPEGTNYNYSIINITNNYTYIWMEFPGCWGVPEEYLDVPTFEWKSDAPSGPKHNGCWHNTYPPGFSNYNGE